MHSELRRCQIFRHAWTSYFRNTELQNVNKASQPTCMDVDQITSSQGWKRKSSRLLYQNSSLGQISLFAIGLNHQVLADIYLHRFIVWGHKRPCIGRDKAELNKSDAWRLFLFFSRLCAKEIWYQLELLKYSYQILQRHSNTQHLPHLQAHLPIHLQTYQLQL